MTAPVPGAAVLVLTARMPGLVLMAVMAALDIGVVIETACKECPHGFVRAAGHAAVQLDASLCQRLLCACADTTADQSIHLLTG